MVMRRSTASESCPKSVWYSGRLRLLGAFGLALIRGGRIDEAISHAVDGLEILRRGRIGFDLFAEPADLRGDRSGEVRAVDRPDVVHELLARKNLPEVLHEEEENIEL